MHLIQIDHRVFDAHRDGSPITLVAAMREVYGTGNARVLRADGTPVVTNAGSSDAVTYAPTGRTVRRRMTWRANHAWHAANTR